TLFPGGEQALLLQQLQGGIHRARARSPQPPAAILQTANYFVTVGGAVHQSSQQRLADVAPAHPAPTAPASAAACPGWAGPELPRAPVLTSRTVHGPLLSRFE